MGSEDYGESREYDSPEGGGYEIHLAPTDQFEEFREEIARWLEEATGSPMENQIFVSDAGDLLFLMDLQPTGERGEHGEEVIAPNPSDWEHARSVLLRYGADIGPYSDMENSDTNLVSLAKRTLAAREKRGG